MTLLTASTMGTSTAKWKVAVFAGVATAIVAAVLVLLINTPVLPAILGLVLGAAPVVGFDLARGALGKSWRPVIAGLIGNILFLAAIFVPGAAPVVVPVVGILSMILWPIIVGAMVSEFSLGRLFLWSLIGLVVGVVAVLVVVAPILGQDPYAWLMPAAIVFWGVWGAAVGIGMGR